MSKIKIICRRPGMRRCGIAHPAECEYEADRWSDDEIAVFETDPQFEVVQAEVKENGTDDNDGKATKPEGDALTEAIIAEVRKLPAGEKAKVSGISEALGYTITGKELGAALAQMKEQGSNQN